MSVFGTLYVKKSNLALLAAFFLPGVSIACRTPYKQSSDLLAASSQAFIARISAVSVPDLDDPEIAAKQDAKLLVLTSDRHVRLVPIRDLKGTAPQSLDITVGECEGAAEATLGGLVVAYKAPDGWRLEGAKSGEVDSVEAEP